MINAKYNTFWERLFAGILDGVLLVPIAYFDSYFLNSLSETVTAVSWLVFSRLFFLLYSGIMHWKGGQTLGKRIFSIKVIDHSEKTGLSLKQAFLRDGFYSVLVLASVGMMLYNIHTMNRFSFLAIEPYDSYLQYFLYIWFILEMTTMFGNKKKRALHDFIGNSVVVKLR